MITPEGRCFTADRQSFSLEINSMIRKWLFCHPETNRQPKCTELMIYYLSYLRDSQAPLNMFKSRGSVESLQFWLNACFTASGWLVGCGLKCFSPSQSLCYAYDDPCSFVALLVSKWLWSIILDASIDLSHLSINNCIHLPRWWWWLHWIGH